jgi:ABC-type multidrug transport system fused ATPase/permease subunit
MGMSHIQQGDTSFARIKALFEIPNEIEDTGSENLGPFQSLEVRGLSYRYGGALREALHEISFRVEKGQILGVIGPTGAGKSTLIELLARVLALQKGEIYFNGISLERIRLNSLRGLMTVVPQEAFLFSEKVSDNVALGNEMNRAEIEAACRAVDLSDEIRGFPGEYDAYLGERGVNLSGGQKQRLALARALARSTPLILLDDALSAVDAKTEERILRHLKNNLSSALIVSHRVKSVRWADQILVLRDGAVEAIGTHDELLVTSPTYKNLEFLQREAMVDEQPTIS